MSLSGQRRVSEAEVLAIPEPEWTKSWHPVGHGKVIEVLDRAVTDLGLEVAGKEYSLTAEGANMFGSWELHPVEEGADKVMLLGIRNSVNMSFALGITAGQRVFVCDNMVFSGDFITFRRHTGRLDLDELKIIADHSIHQVIGRMEELAIWIDQMREYPMSESDVKLLTYDAMNEGVIPPSRFRAFQTARDEEKKDNPHPESLNCFYGACTRLMRCESLFNISDKSDPLNALMELYMMTHSTKFVRTR